MTPYFPVRAALAVAICAAFLNACDRQTTADAQRSAASAGQKVDKALDRAGQKLAEAGEKVAASVKEAVTPDAAATTSTTTTPSGKSTTTITTGPATSASVTGLSARTKSTLGDAAITASIRTDFLKDPDLSVLKIDVDTRDGVVILNGLADNEAARGRAERIAGAIKGVREVRNHLTVKRA